MKALPPYGPSCRSTAKKAKTVHQATKLYHHDASSIALALIHEDGPQSSPQPDRHLAQQHSSTNIIQRTIICFDPTQLQSHFKWGKSKERCHCSCQSYGA